MKPAILTVDDEASVLESFCVALEDDYRIIPASDGKAGLEALEANNIDLVLLDIMMPKMDGIETLRRMKKADPDVDVIMVTVKKDVESVVTCMKLGARDYISKPFQIEELIHTIERELEAGTLRKENRFLRSEIRGRSGERNIVSRSTCMQHISDTIAKVAPQDSTVLITGETGTGKELVALEIYRRSHRNTRPLCIVNCAAIPSELIESELFGHERGAFTGAVRQRLGRFELADGGVLFLDEIADIPAGVQVRLLRVLQERE
ncbi:MAG: sigma-54-dependent Fis family transcriptional regulator, partial [Candidatus Latescibacteria bacterium]|nr:sigma-54-dependent Fis family transcriptional regulator [Candidatus Latescibacterota bacterium]